MYVHYRLSDNTPFYVGKGSGNRVYTCQHRNTYWVHTKNKHGLKVEIVFDGLTEDEAFQCEKDTILEFSYFGYKLTNLTSGGEGASYKRSEETKRRMSIAFRGRQHSSETRNKIGKSRKYPTGLDNVKADKNIYHFTRISDGVVFIGTRSDLCTTFNLKTALVGGLFKTKKRKIACGWKLTEETHAN